MQHIAYAVTLLARKNVVVGSINFKANTPKRLTFINKALAKALIDQVLTMPEVPNFDLMNYRDRVAFVNTMIANGKSPFMNQRPAEVSDADAASLEKSSYYSPVNPTARFPDGSMLVGSGIPSYFIDVDQVPNAEIYLAAYNFANINQIPAGIPQGDGSSKFVVELVENDPRIRIFFGVTSLNGKITDTYDVQFTIEQGSNAASFDLVATDEPQAYNWQSVEDVDYVITDSSTNSLRTSVQNVTQISFLQEAGLLPVGDLEGEYTATITMTNKQTEEVHTSVILIEAVNP